MAIIGPGAAQEVATDVKSLLDGASEYEVVTVLNPLSDDFAVRVAQDVPVNMPIEIRAKTAMHQNESDVSRTLGFPLKNPDFQARKHISIDTVIPAGETRNFKGSEAQVAVRQLVNEIMQREGNQRLMSDPNLRHEVEERIVINRGNMQELMDAQLQTPRQQIDDAINKSNEVTDDQPFPGLNETVSPSPEASNPSGEPSVQQERRGPGRPKQTQQA